MGKLNDKNALMDKKQRDFAKEEAKLTSAVI